MHYPYFDYITIFIYLAFGLLCVLSVHIAKGGDYSYEKSLKGFLLLFISLFIFTVFRKVGCHLGGEDAIKYQQDFIYGISDARFDNTDILYGFITRLIREFTDNPFIYRGVCYSIIVYGYVKVINSLSPQNISPIPFVCIMIPLMRSLGSMRNSMSISLFLIALVAYYNKKYIWCMVWLTASVMMHRLTFAMLSLFPFLWIADIIIKKKSIFSFIIIISVLTALSYFVAKILQQYIILFSLFEDNGSADMWNLTRNKDANVLLNWPMYLPHLLLLLFLLIGYKKLPKTKNTLFLLYLFSFDFIMLPATLVLGLYRYTEYLYIPNLILWGVLIANYYKRFSYSSRFVIQGGFLIGFSALVCIRLIREYEDLSVMPYLFFWQ